MGWLFGGPSFDTSKSMRCFNNELYGVCGGCVYMNPKNYTSDLFSGYSFKCTRTGGYYKWNESACSMADCVDPERIDCAERYKDFTGRKYFILTAIAEILGFSLDNRLFTEIISLIDVIRNDKSMSREAIGYDKFGPEIADNLRRDNDRIELCNYLLENFIVKIYCLIGLNKLDEAITLYENMVRFLFYRYKNINNYAEIIEVNHFVNPKLLVK